MGMERRMQALKELGAQRTVYDAERAAYSSGFSAGERRAERSVMEDDRSAKVLERCLSRSGLDVDIWWFWYLQTFDASASVHTWCVARRDGAALQSYVFSAVSLALRWAGAVSLSVPGGRWVPPTRGLALPSSLCGLIDQFGEPGLFATPDSMDSHRRTCMLT